MTTKDFFFCYSKRTMKYLKYDKGFNFITNAMTKDGEEFWLFIKTEELREALKEVKSKNE